MYTGKGKIPTKGLHPVNIYENRLFRGEQNQLTTTKAKADAPAQVSQIDLDRPNPAVPGYTDIDSSETRQVLQANDAEKMTPDDANELNSENNF